MSPNQKAFERWFGRSTIRLPDGTPRIVYHGTRSPVIFDVFETGTIVDEEGEHVITSSGDPSAFLGPHFTASLQLAEKFAAGRGADWDRKRFVKRFGKDETVGRVYAVYLRIERPKVFDSDEALWEFIFAHGESREIDDFLEFENFEDEDLEELEAAIVDPVERAKIYDQAFHDLSSDSDEGSSPREIAAEELGASVRAQLERAGFDGVVYRNTVEGGGNSYIVFSPVQIKSATDNRGTFLIDEPSILGGLGRRRR